MKYILAIAFAIILISTLSRDRVVDTQHLVLGDKILAFGDSLTFGHGVEPLQSYPSILSRLSGYSVTNAGVSGEVSSRGRIRLSDILKNSNAKLMILCHGGNDILQRRSHKQLKENLSSMVDIAKERDIQVLLIGVPNISLSGLSTLTLYKEIAQEKGIPYMDSLLEDILSDSSLKGDRIHPNALGYQKMAEKIYHRLLKYNIF